MKRIHSIIAVALVATMSLGCVSVFASEKTKVENKPFRPAVMMNRELRGNRNIGIEMSEEMKAERIEKQKAFLAEKLAAGKITQEEYDEIIAATDAGTYKAEKKMYIGMKDKGNKAPEMTEEQKAERIEKQKASLAEKLAAGKITQEKYDETIAAIDAGTYKSDINKADRKIGCKMKGRNHNAPKMNKEKKAADNTTSAE